jgi:predicted nucleic acid-binding protein
LVADLTIDPKLLPSRALLDTGVLIRALGQRKDADTKICRAFFDAMIQEDKRMLISAATLAEVIRQKAERTTPRTRSVIVVPFDQAAARILGRAFPLNTLKEARGPGGEFFDYYKYDALIIACAMRHAAEAIVCIDKGMAKLAKMVNIDAVHPSTFIDSQPPLFPLGLPKPKPPPDPRAPPAA